ncbi:MAG: hypothetical protein RLY89_1383 [Bacteroidota bacterium]|jgi:hypothetical protein
MKKITTLFLFFPVYLFAQKNTNMPLIESVTGDTISGKYNDIVWNYDNLNRVVSTVNRNCYLANTISNPSGQLLVDTIQIQHFDYKGNQLQPFIRRVVNYDYTRIEYDNSNSNREPLEYKAGRAEMKMEWQDSVFHYYIYQNNQRIRDSVIYHTPKCCNENKIEVTEKRVRVKYTKSTVETEFFDKEIKKTTDNVINKDSIVYRNNISTVLSYSKDEYFSTSLTCTFSKFDSAINPFHHLNISSSLVEGKVSFDKIDLNNISNDFYIEDAIIQWHYINENNPLVFEIKRGKSDLPFKDKMLLTYTYNEFKLPVTCNTEMTKYFTNGEFVGKYQKRFTFRYK